MTWLLTYSHAGIRSRTDNHLQLNFKSCQGVKLTAQEGMFKYFGTIQVDSFPKRLLTALASPDNLP